MKNIEQLREKDLAGLKEELMSLRRNSLVPYAARFG